MAVKPPAPHLVSKWVYILFKLNIQMLRILNELCFKVTFFLTLFFLPHRCWRVSIKDYYELKETAIKSLKSLRDCDLASVEVVLRHNEKAYHVKLT